MTGEIIYKRDGGRIIELYQPFEHSGKKIEAINFSPVTFGDTLNWQENKYKTILALMSKMSGLEEHVLRELRYPDTDRVMAIFVDMLPPEIRNSIGQRNEEALARSNGQGEFSAEEEAMLHPQQSTQDPMGLGVDLDGADN